MIQKAEPCHLFSPAYMEFEFLEEEAAWAFPASLFLQTIDDQLWWGRCAFSVVSFWHQPLPVPGVTHWSVLCLLSPSWMWGQKVFCSCDSPCGEFFLTVLAAGKLAAFSGSFFIQILCLQRHACAWLVLMHFPWASFYYSSSCPGHGQRMELIDGISTRGKKTQSPEQGMHSHWELK